MSEKMWRTTKKDVIPRETVAVILIGSSPKFHLHNRMHTEIKMIEQSSSFSVNTSQSRSQKSGERETGEEKSECELGEKRPSKGEFGRVCIFPTDFIYWYTDFEKYEYFSHLILPKGRSISGNKSQFNRHMHNCICFLTMQHSCQVLSRSEKRCGGLQNLPAGVSFRLTTSRRQSFFFPATFNELQIS